VDVKPVKPEAGGPHRQGEWQEDECLLAEERRRREHDVFARGLYIAQRFQGRPVVAVFPHQVGRKERQSDHPTQPEPAVGQSAPARDQKQAHKEPKAKEQHGVLVF
jgi:hypothetical protein